MEIKPKISVILPLYNASRYVRAAIQSVLDQTYPDFELLIINDGSTDDSLALVQGMMKDTPDSRVKLYLNEKNLGLSKTLNYGLKIAKGDFVARMDADDICHPMRFEKQVRFLNANSKVDILGTAITTFGATRSATIYNPESDVEIKAALLFGCPIAHPTVMFRREILERNGLNYRPRFDGAEDYDLWTESSKKLVLHNLQESLLRYRVHPAQVSVAKAADQQRKARAIRDQALFNVGVQLSKQTLEYHHKFACYEAMTDDYFDEASFDLWRKELLDFLRPTDLLGAVDLEVRKRLTQMFWNHFSFKHLRRLWVEREILDNDILSLNEIIFFLSRSFLRKIVQLKSSNEKSPKA